MIDEKKRVSVENSLKNQDKYTTYDTLMTSMKKGSQARTILEHLVEHEEGITTWDAFMHYNITRLASRIHDLRDLGVPIRATQETKVTVSAEGQRISKTYARYTLER